MSSDELVEAIENGNLNAVKDLIEQQGVNVNTQSETFKVYPIIMAFERGEDEIVDYLLSKGADVNVREDNGATVLLKAIDDWDDLENAKKIIEAGANLNFLYRNEYNENDDELKSVLMIASSRLLEPFVRLFLTAKANVNLRSSKGKTAVMFAAAAVENDQAKQLKILRLLINYAANYDLADNEGRTVLDMCSNDECRQLIQQELMERGRGRVRGRIDSESDDEYREEDDAMDMLDDEVPEDDPESWNYEPLLDQNDPVYSVDFSPDGTEFVVGGAQIDLSLFTKRFDLTIRQPAVNTLVSSTLESVYTPNGEYIVIAGGRLGVIIKSRQKNDGIAFLNENGSQVTHVDVSPNSQMILSASKDKIIRLWNITTGALVRRFSDHVNDKNMIESVKFSPDGEYFASSGDDIVIWSLIHGHMKTIKGNGEDVLTSFVYSPDGKRIASLTDNNCFVWEVKPDLKLAFPPLSSNGRVLTAVTYTPDGKYIITARYEDADGINATLMVWDANTGSLLSRLDGGMSYIFSLAVSKDNQHLLIGGVDEEEKGTVVLGKISDLLANHQVTPFPKELEQTQLKVQHIRLTEEPDIFDALMAESYPLSQYQKENTDSIVFLTNAKNGFGYDRDQLRNMTIGAEDYYFKCLNLNDRLVVALSNVAGEKPFVLLRSAGTFYVPAEQLQAALDDERHDIFMLREYDVLPYTASIGVIEVSHAQRNHRGEQINVVSKDHCQAGSNKKAYEIIALDVNYV